jgi:hypothetical protein
LAAVAVEETLEMLGIVVFLFALLSYIAEHIGEIRVHFRREEPSSGIREVGESSALASKRAEFVGVSQGIDDES